MTHTSAESPGQRHLLPTLARLLAAHPAWLLAHAQGYADLALEQAQLASAAWQRRVALLLLAWACVGLCVALACVAVMLWAIAPALAGARLWMLVLVPLLPLAAALALRQVAQGVQRPPGLDSLKQQWADDLAILREAAPP